MNAGQPVIITHPDKVLFPEAGFTKRDLADYYRAVSGYLLPFLRNRPLMLRRFPQGIGYPGFYQKAPGHAFPEWITRVPVSREKQEPIEMAVINTKAALSYIINLNTLELHPWLSTINDLHKPDKLIFDLDPAGGDFKAAVKGAMLLRELLEKQYGLTCFVMTTGSSGLHIAIPVETTQRFDKVRSFARAIGEEISVKYPADFTTGQRKEARKGRLYIDYMRNSYAQTAVVPYSVRALPGAPVAAPLFWEELQDISLNARQFNIKSMTERLKTTGDPWQNFRKSAKDLAKAIKLQQEVNK